MHTLSILVAYLLVFLILPVGSIFFNATVSLNGIGHSRSIGAAIATAPNYSNSRFYINVKPGTYNEHVEVPTEKTFLALVGEDAATTVIVDNRSNHGGFRTSDSATFVVNGNNFMAISITFENSAEAENGQAV